MKNWQFLIMAIAMIASMFFFMAWFIPAATTVPPEYVQWEKECAAKGGAVFRDGDRNVYCVTGKMDLRPSL